MTLICIPTVDEGGLLSSISTHLEKSPCLTFIKLENGKIKEIKVIETKNKPIENPKTFTELILDSNVDIIICGCLSEKYKFILYENEVKIFSGEFGKIKDVINEYKVGFLRAADENFCKLVVKNQEEKLNESSYNIYRT